MTGGGGGARLQSGGHGSITHEDPGLDIAAEQRFKSQGFPSKWTAFIGRLTPIPTTRQVILTVLVPITLLTKTIKLNFFCISYFIY